MAGKPRRAPDPREMRWENSCLDYSPLGLPPLISDLRIPSLKK